MRSFPERFDFAADAWKGRRARSFTRREDAYQRLVGAALREEMRPFVYEVPTEGQDGGIDAYIEAGAPACSILPPLVGPTVVECKDNDDTRSRSVDNVLAAWKKVEAKLTRQAASGWPGLYEPWSRARGYVYVTSARLSQDARDKLKGLIETCFERLRARGLCRVEQVCVVDWCELREMLDRHPRLADDWLGTQSTALVAHSEREAAATEFARYLKEIPFVPPDPEDRAHPDRLFKLVDMRAQEGGVLVVGRGGIGKTRLLFEVARRADDAGWRVLHAGEGESALRSDALSEEVLCGSGNVLLVCDYFDRLKPDIRWIRSRLFQEAAARGLRIAFIASARVPERVVTSPDVEEFFEVVEVRHDAKHAKRILAELEGQVAPTAVGMLGAKQIERLTGEVPAIALFFLREIERRASKGTLDARTLEGVRPGDLVRWVRAHLHEAQLLAPVSESSGTVPLDARSVAAASVLAASPQPEDHARVLAFDICRRVAELYGERPLTRRQAMGLVDSLCEQGWLDARDGQLAACHDVVADQMLVEILRDGRGRLREELVDVLFGPAATSARLLGRVAVALGRLFGQLDMFEPVLQGAAARWLSKEAAAVGDALAAADAAEAAYALHAILSGPPWRDEIPHVWDSIVDPWRVRHVASEASWPVHVALLGMRNLPRRHAVVAVQMALEWVHDHGGTEDAAAVLVHLLDSVDLDNEAESDAITAALLWNERHREAEIAPVVLGMVVRREHIPSEKASHAARAILDWCRVRTAAPRAGFALGMLLGRDDLGAEVEPQAMATAWAWLQQHEETDEAGFVLASLLGLEQTEPAPASDLVRRSVSWCEGHEDALAAGFVLNTLLGYPGLPVELAQRAAELACRWVHRRENFFEKVLVLASLLQSAELSATDLDVLVGTGMTWLSRYGDYPQSVGLLPQILERADVSTETRSKLERMAADWCEKRSEHSYVGVVLSVLLERPLEPTVADRVVRLSTAFVDRHRHEDLFPVVLGTLLKQRSHLPQEAPRLAELARAWLSEHRNADMAGFVFMGLLVPGEVRHGDKPIADWAASWLAERHGHPAALPLLARLLADKGCPADVVPAAMAWLEQNCQMWGAVLVLTHILGHVQPGSPGHDRVERSTHRWLEAHERRFEAQAVHVRLLQQVDLRDSQAAVRSAMRWLDRYGDRLEAIAILRPLLERLDLDPVLSSRAIDLAIGWLEAHGSENVAVFVLYPLSCRGDLGDTAALSALGAAFKWLDEHPSYADEMGALLEAILGLVIRQPNVSDHLAQQALERALAWLDGHPGLETTGLVATRICFYPKIDPDTAAKAADRVFEWLEHQGKAPSAWLPLAGLLECRRGQDPRIEQVVTASAAWIEEHGDRREADLVLRNLVVFTPPELDDLQWIPFHALAWLGRRTRNGMPHMLFDLFYLPERPPGMSRKFARLILKEQVLLLGRALADGSLDLVASAMPALLPLAERKGTVRLRQKCDTLARKFARAAGPSSEEYRYFLDACLRLMEAGAWPSRQDAEEHLARLGVKHPR